MSVPLHGINGHIFTIQLQGISSFNKTKKSDSRRTIVRLQTGSSEPEAIKIVGRIYAKDKLKGIFKSNSHVGYIGPDAEMVTPSGRSFLGTLLAPPLANPSQDHILILTSEGVPKIDKQEESALTFIGGLDHHNTINDVGSETSFLALSYPLENNEFERLKDRIGCMDIIME